MRPLCGQRGKIVIQYAAVTTNCGFQYQRCKYCECWFEHVSVLKEHTKRHIEMRCVTMHVKKEDSDDAVEEREFENIRGTNLTDGQMRNLLNFHYISLRDTRRSLIFFVVQIICRDMLKNFFYCTFCAFSSHTLETQQEHFFREHLDFLGIKTRPSMYCI
jgi:hypothetical protein